MHRLIPLARPIAAIAAASISCRGDPTAGKTNLDGFASTKSTAASQRGLIAVEAEWRVVMGRCGDATARNQERELLRSQANDRGPLADRHVPGQQQFRQVTAWRNALCGETGQSSGSCHDTRVERLHDGVLIDRRDTGCRANRAR
jgi:hypothetical protein